MKHTTHSICESMRKSAQKSGSVFSMHKFGSALVAAIALLAISACPMPNPPDTSAPYPVAVSPSGENINASTVSEIVIRFNEPIRLASGAHGNINLIARAGATISFALPSEEVLVQGMSITLNGVALLAETTYRIAIPAGLIADSAGNTNAEITSTSEAISFTTAADTFPPRVQSFSAEGDSVDPSTNRITITFNEEIQRGTGSLSLESTGSTMQSFNIVASTMPEETLITGNTLVLLGVNLASGSAYSIHFPTGLVSDRATTPNPVAALTRANTTLRFRTATADTSGPRFVSIFPAGNSVEASSTTELIIRFNENIQAGEGSITLRSNAPSSNSVNSFDVSDMAQVNFSADSLSLLGLNLVQGTGYSLEIPAGAVLDSANNPNAHIPAEGEIGFATRETVPPAFASIDPSGSEVNAATVSEITIRFSENIRQGAGNVLLFENGSEIMQFGVTNAMQVRIEGMILTLLSPMLLRDSPNAYSITIPAGAVLDNANNPNAQIPVEGAASVGFSTSDSAPPMFVNITIHPTLNTYGVEGRARFDINFNERILPIEGGEIRMTDSVSDVTQVFRLEFNNIFSGANIDVMSEAGSMSPRGVLYRSTSSQIKISELPGVDMATSATLHLDRTYTIRIPADIISDDLAGLLLRNMNDFTYNERNNLNEEIVIEFTPSATPTPPAIMGTPQRNGQNIEIHFNEFLGRSVTGEIELLREGFSQNYSARSISISGSTIALIGAYALVTPGVEHSIRIPVGSIQDSLGTENNTELSISFTTIDSI